MAKEGMSEKEAKEKYIDLAEKNEKELQIEKAA